MTSIDFYSIILYGICLLLTIETNNIYLIQVFADHDTSCNPIDVPREWIWNLPRRTVYFGTSVPTIFKGAGSTHSTFYRILNMLSLK